MDEEDSQTRINPQAGPRFDQRTGFASLPVGKLFLDRYEIRGILGRGGMGTVYRVTDTVGDIDLALKALPPEVAMDPTEMQRVRDNFKLVHELHHPNIASVKTLEQDTSNGSYYLLMEMVEGENLMQFADGRGGPQALEFWLRYIKQIADGLDFAHQRGIIHRDIKPSNLYLNADGDIKLLDFGIASQVRTSMMHITGMQPELSGTATYMPPEQWKGQRQGPESDQYALAATVYHLIEGRCPFESKHLGALRSAVLNETPQQPARLPDRQWQVLRQALAKEPEARFKSCGAFYDALETATRPREFKAFKRSVSAVIGLVLAGAIGFFWPREAIPVVAAPVIEKPVEPVVLEDPAPDPKARDEADHARAQAVAYQYKGRRMNVAAFYPADWSRAMEALIEANALFKAEAFTNATPAYAAASTLFTNVIQRTTTLQTEEARAEAMRMADELSAAQKALNEEWRSVGEQLASVEGLAVKMPEQARAILADLETANEALYAAQTLADLDSPRTTIQRVRRTLNQILVELAKAPKVLAPPIPKPAVAQTGNVLVTLKPPPDFRGDLSGLQLTHNGKVLDRPFPVALTELPIGRHQFQLNRDAVLEPDAASLAVLIEAGKDQHLEIPLRYKPSFLVVEVEPEQAELLLRSDAGEKVIGAGKLPTEPGSYQIIAKANGYKTLTQAVTLERGKSELVSLKLKTVKVSVRP
ncbi:MAG: hypothetical protein ACI9TH_001970 [Kiritimatiellia bacterium]|jgi:hypothetical protein